MEFEWIEQLKSTIADDAGVTLGIGDDCAILKQNEQYDQLVTSDMLLDGVHFLYDCDKESAQSMALIAYKSIAVSVSDIAAMGGEPQTAFISLAIPRNWTDQQANELFNCFAQASKKLEVTIAGGDTTSWDGHLAINITLLGRVEKSKAIRRSGAKDGDRICVSGSLGGSILGKHLAFTPLVPQARWLREHFNIHAMIDISDGLLADLGHILKESECGAEIIASQIPISEAAYQFDDDKPPLERALTDGEDFELLWTMPESDYQKSLKTKKDFIEIHSIGRITKQLECFVIDKQGQKQRRTSQGYVHQLKTDS